MHHTFLAPIAAACLALFTFAAQANPLAATPSTPTGTATLAKPVPAKPAAVNSALDGELFYYLLLGEMSISSGAPSEGFQLLLESARKTNDPALYNRAIDVAVRARAGDDALQAARAWQQAQPRSALANERLFQILVALNRIPDTAAPLRSWISNAPAADRPAFITRALGAYSRSTDKKLAISTAEQALTEYFSSSDVTTAAAAWASLGRLQLAANDTAAALEATRKAQRAKPSDANTAILALDLMDPKLPEAEALVKTYLATDKPRTDIRMAYGRNMIEQQRYSDAKSLLPAVTTEQADFADAWLALGSLQLQDNQLPAADASLKRYIQLAQEQGSPEERQRGLTQSYLLLAQVAEKNKDFPLAESWLAKIDSPQALVSAQNRRASILAKQGKLQEARQLIRNLPERSPEDRLGKQQAEVQLLRDNKQYEAAYKLLGEMMASNPQDPDLGYEQSLMAEKLERFDEMERLLRLQIAAKPESSTAYNALGYSFADRNIRLPEAKKLLEKALALSGNDPFITDSLGWAEFRMGNTAQALALLQRAYAARPDPEIAAHLGEVYWASGQKDKAKAIWKEGLLLSSDNETLLQTLKRLGVKL
jgi:tetratricopeptide (TPR) repeat protein